MSDRLHKLEELVETLRGPGGCPWDQEQELGDLRAYILEEAHELAAAIDAGTPSEISEELGDLLFQLVFASRLAAPSDSGSHLDDVIDGIHQKMVDRHPHVFGEAELPDSAAVRRAWEERKTDQRGSVLAGIPGTLPALLAAYRISQKAAGVGFDWPDVAAVLEKVEEELSEVRSAITDDLQKPAIEEEVGDLLLATANLARTLGIDPEAALVGANRKFQRRFEAMEGRLQPGERLSERTHEQLDALWRRAKEEEA